MKTDLKPLEEALKAAQIVAQQTEKSVDDEYEAFPTLMEGATEEQRVGRREARTAWLALDDIVKLLRDARDLLRDIETS